MQRTNSTSRHDVRRVPQVSAAWVVLFLMPLAPAQGTSLDSLTFLALRSNPRIVSARAAQRAAAEAVPAAGALPDPMLMFRAEGTPIDRPSPTNAEMAGIELTQMVPFPGKRGLMRQSMREEAAMLAAQADRTALEVVTELREAYAEYYALDRQTQIVRESIAFLEETTEIVETRYEVGATPMQDLLKMMVELERERNRLVVLEARVPAVVARIESAVGGELPGPLGAPSLPDTAMAAGSTEDLEARALAAQPMIRMQERALAQAEANVRLAGRERYPDFTIGAEYMANRDMPDTWTGMLGLNLPLRRGSRYEPRIREARARQSAAEADLVQARIETAAMIREAAAMVRGSRAMVNLYRTTVIPRAEQSLEATRTAYQTDRVEFLDLLDGHRSLLEFRMMAEEAMAEYLTSRARLDLAVGESAAVTGGPAQEDLERSGGDDER